MSDETEDRVVTVESIEKEVEVTVETIQKTVLENMLAVEPDVEIEARMKDIEVDNLTDEGQGINEKDRAKIIPENKEKIIDIFEMDNNFIRPETTPEKNENRSEQTFSEKIPLRRKTFDETECGNACGNDRQSLVLPGVIIPSPFEKSLFWPEPHKKTNKRKSRADAWREYFLKKEEAQKKALEEKEDRKRKKEENKKISAKKRRKRGTQQNVE